MRRVGLVFIGFPLGASPRNTGLIPIVPNKFHPAGVGRITRILLFYATLYKR
jgi:hypothetical protein